MSSRIYLIRHGETEWSLNQQHTGSTEVLLTSNGEKQAQRTAETFVGDGKLIQPKRIKRIFCSPRKRARQTLRLLGLGDEDELSVSGLTSSETPSVKITELLREWDYGNYEGLTIEEVRKLRRSRNLDEVRPWNIWRDGCEGGE
ncbi:histidine phosphatase superfamily [Penicillium cinerascens]|uniref:Histidine phosphatase superfamily n=1 Tax=Penicillium cinerascens TaxID=70096 RepID=A0A9W9J5M9_9EURO|nr:histidine phosphatase superfamily [Penicillium cinerascens]KAJ5190219.1 histidine phosphatase superfamily [Penicillium cinerascens]